MAGVGAVSGGVGGGGGGGLSGGMGQLGGVSGATSGGHGGLSSGVEKAGFTAPQGGTQVSISETGKSLSQASAAEKGSSADFGADASMNKMSDLIAALVLAMLTEKK